MNATDLLLYRETPRRRPPPIQRSTHRTRRYQKRRTPLQPLPRTTRRRRGDERHRPKNDRRPGTRGPPSPPPNPPHRGHRGRVPSYDRDRAVQDRDGSGLPSARGSAGYGERGTAGGGAAHGAVCGRDPAVVGGGGRGGAGVCGGGWGDGGEAARYVRDAVCGDGCGGTGGVVRDNAGVENAVCAGA